MVLRKSRDRTMEQKRVTVLKIMCWTGFAKLAWAAMVRGGMVGTVVFVLTACGGGDNGQADAVPSAAQLCATIGVVPRILNGTVCITPERSPVVQLYVSKSGSMFMDLCSGTVVGPRQVLTAAHCLSSSTVAVSTPLWENGLDVGRLMASSWVVHPHFRIEPTGFINDAAVVTFEVDLPNPSLPLLTGEPTVLGHRVYLAGWGAPVLDFAVGYADLSIVNATHIGYVYGNTASNTCSGDSGGPMYRVVNGQPAVIGITSTGTLDDCGEGDRPLFTNLQSEPVLGFLREEIANLREH